MNKILAVAAATAVLLSAAPAAQASPFEFGGFYAGAHAGYSKAKAKFKDGSPDFREPEDEYEPFDNQVALAFIDQIMAFGFGGGGNLDDYGTMGGLQAGYNFVNGNILWGFEADISLTNADPDGKCPNNPGASCEVDSGPMATVRGRLGYTMDDWLIYVTGGAAGSNFELDTNGPGGTNSGLVGWTVGGGAEYLVGDIVGVKLEYRYLKFGDFGSFDNKLRDSTGAKIKVEMHTVMGGVNFHF